MSSIFWLTNSTFDAGFPPVKHTFYSEVLIPGYRLNNEMFDVSMEYLNISTEYLNISPMKLIHLCLFSFCNDLSHPLKCQFQNQKKTSTEKENFNRKNGAQSQNLMYTKIIDFDNFTLDSVYSVQVYTYKENTQRKHTY